MAGLWPNRSGPSHWQVTERWLGQEQRPKPPQLQLPPLSRPPSCRTRTAHQTLHNPGLSKLPHTTQLLRQSTGSRSCSSQNRLPLGRVMPWEQSPRDRARVRLERRHCMSTLSLGRSRSHTSQSTIHRLLLGKWLCSCWRRLAALLEEMAATATSSQRKEHRAWFCLTRSVLLPKKDF